MTTCEVDGCRQNANTHVALAGVGSWVLCPDHAEDLARGAELLLTADRRLQRVYAPRPRLRLEYRA